ncbi:putative DUF669 domain-containing protein [Gammaproteobacteria bacterium]
MSDYYTDENESLCDLSNVDDGFTPIPEGIYRMQAVNVDLKSTKDERGKYLSVQFEVIGPEYARRKIFENFNIKHDNHQTVEIALKSLKGWIKACGFTGEEPINMKFMKSLEGCEFMASVIVAPDKSGRFGDQNRLRRYMPVGDAPSPVKSSPQEAPKASPSKTKAPVAPPRRMSASPTPPPLMEWEKPPVGRAPAAAPAHDEIPF